MSAPPDVEVLPDVDRLADAAAHRFIDAGNAAIHTHGRFVVALSGGSTPRSVYTRLASHPLVSRMDWSLVQILWGDERCVPPDHPSSNYRMARESLLDHVPIPTTNVHRIRGEDEPVDAAVAYEGVVRSVLQTPIGPPQTAPARRLDLVLLSLGSDGHTASMFPGGDSLHAGARWVTAEYVARASMWRITMTATILNAAAEVVFIVSGHEKATVVRQVLEGPHEPDTLPARLIVPRDGHIRWLLDSPAAADLRHIPR